MNKIYSSSVGASRQLFSAFAEKTPLKIETSQKLIIIISSLALVVFSSLIAVYRSLKKTPKAVVSQQKPESSNNSPKPSTIPYIPPSPLSSPIKPLVSPLNFPPTPNNNLSPIASPKSPSKPLSSPYNPPVSPVQFSSFSSPVASPSKPITPPLKPITPPSKPITPLSKSVIPPVDPVKPQNEPIVPVQLTGPYFEAISKLPLHKLEAEIEAIKDQVAKTGSAEDKQKLQQLFYVLSTSLNNLIQQQWYKFSKDDNKPNKVIEPKDRNNFYFNLLTLSEIINNNAKDKNFVFNCAQQIHAFLADVCFTSKTAMCLAESKKEDYILLHPLMDIANTHFKDIELKDPDLALNLKIKFANVPLRDDVNGIKKSVIGADGKMKSEIVKPSVPVNRAKMYKNLFLTETDQLNALLKHFQNKEDNLVAEIISSLPKLKNLTYKDLLRFSKMTSKGESQLSTKNRLKLRQAFIDLMGKQAPVWDDTDPKNDKLVCIELSKYFNNTTLIDVLLKYYENEDKSIKNEDQLVDAIIKNFPYLKSLKPDDALKLSKLLSFSYNESPLCNANISKLQKVFFQNNVGFSASHLCAYLSKAFPQPISNQNDNKTLEALHRSSETRDFFHKQEGLPEDEIQIPRWYHTTHYKHMQPIIELGGKIKVLHEKMYSGAWVSTQIEGGSYGDCVLVMNNGISKLDPDVFIGFEDLESKTVDPVTGKPYKNMRWRGLQVDIPLINTDTKQPYVCMVGVNTDEKKCPDAKKKIIQYLKKRGIENVRIASYDQIENMHKEILAILGNPNLSEQWWGQADLSKLDKGL